MYIFDVLFRICVLFRVIERLRFAEEFLPAFQEVITELQSHLGVTSLGAITPTLKSRLAS